MFIVRGKNSKPTSGSGNLSVHCGSEGLNLTSSPFFYVFCRLKLINPLQFLLVETVQSTRSAELAVFFYPQLLKTLQKVDDCYHNVSFSLFYFVGDISFYYTSSFWLCSAVITLAEYHNPLYGCLCT